MNREQMKLGLWDEAKVAKMTAAENIDLNAQAMRNAGVPGDIVEILRREALRHAATLPGVVVP